MSPIEMNPEMSPIQISAVAFRLQLSKLKQKNPIKWEEAYKKAQELCILLNKMK